MRRRPYVPSSLPLLSLALLTALLLTACNPTKQGASKEAAAPASPATTERVFVMFEGPWAFVPDPNDATKLLALAPKTKSHNDLFVAASNNSPLAAGVYDLSIPLAGAVGAATFDPNIVHAKTTIADVKRVLNTKLERYAIRLPKPEAFVSAMRFRSRVGPTYPPDASTEKDYVSAVSLRYSVSSLNGFSLAGTPDTGSFSPLLLQVDTPLVQFIIEPNPTQMDPTDKCGTHWRQAFHDLTKLVNVVLYVDYPDTPSSCHDNDPQKPKTAAQQVGPFNLRPSLLHTMATLLGEGHLPALGVDSETNTDVWGLVEPRAWAGTGNPYVMTAVYLFGRAPTTCRTPILVLSTDGS